MKPHRGTGVSWDKAVLGVSLAVMLMAVTVLVGWHFHIRAAIQIFSGLIPMQYNTALCFLALGTAGIGLSRRRSWVVGGFGGVAALMGGTVIFEYVTGRSSGIDTLFFYPWERSLSADPGRMALTTSVCFFLTGGALVNLAARQGTHAIFGIVNSITLSLALTSLIGYAFQITYVLPFSLGSQMALHTSAGFFAFGIAMLGYAWTYAKRGSDGLPQWAAGIGVAFLPVLLPAASSLFSAQSWQAVIVEILLSLIGVGLITAAVLTLTTARVAYQGLLMIAIPLILLLMFVGLVVHVKNKSESAQALAQHSSEVVGASEALLTHLAETESAMRGYIITKDDAFVTVYEQSLASIARASAQLRRLVADNPQQQARATTIEALTVLRTRRFAEVFRLIENGNSTPVPADTKGETGAELMAQIRAEMDAFSREEERLGTERRHVLAASWERLSWLLVAGTSGAILLASMLSLLFSGGISWRLQQLRVNAIGLAEGKALPAAMTGHDEIAELDRVFHTMADSLDEVTRREKAVIDGTSDAIFVKDLEHRYLMINRAGSDTIGRPIAEIIGASNDTLIEADSARRIRRQDDEIIASGHTTTSEFVASNKAGVERIYLTTRGPYRNRQGAIVGTLGISRDITERKQIDAELEHARDAALESVRLKSEFLANMSHEIRTPMNGVIGMTDLLLDDDLTLPQRERAETIRSSADALLRIIDDILDFSKIEAGLLRFEKIDFELRGAVEATVDLLAERAQAKGLELASFVHEDVSTALQGDPGRLRQVLTNLIGNAVKFTERGEVVVSVNRVPDAQAPGMLRFEIRDTGIGISPEGQRGLFRAFTQADGSTTRKYGGTGLGLAISKQLVELMKGQIGIDSVPGEGSTFWFTAQFEEQRAPGQTTREGIGSLSAVRLLIVDDNAANRKILQHETTSWGMIATGAATGKRALELLRAAARAQQPYEIAILDLVMPEMDGFELAETIKTDPLISDVALVLLPSFGRRGDGEKARRAGIAAYLQKPVRQAQLHACLTAVMARSEANPAAMPPLVTRHSMREAGVPRMDAPSSNVRILVAEDNLVNQQVALGQLRNLGYRAAVVSNGRQLLNAIEKNPVDLILMDCQMPEMDGFDATAEIRRREGDSRHTIIIAMTANALDGDHEGCITAGMDDYLSKPVKSDVLRSKLERWTRTLVRDSPSSERPEPTLHAIGAVLDQDQLANLRGLRRSGDGDYLATLIDLFVDQASVRLATLHEAVMSDDAVEIRRVAHLLRGSSATMGATRMAAICQGLESKDPAKDSAALLSQLEGEWVLAGEALAAERIACTARSLAALPNIS